ncbi:hypothetical protein LTR60_004354, partial [Cryomyces antarcticus]
MPAATATVLYPQTSDSDFKLDYYLSSHMPMVMKHFGPHGMTGYNVTKITGTPSGDKAEYSIQCILQFEQADSRNNIFSSATTARQLSTGSKTDE